MRKYVDILIIFCGTALVVFFGFNGIIERDVTTTTVAEAIATLITMTASWIALYYATLRPLFRKPKLIVAPETWAVPLGNISNPTIYMRLEIKNIGLTAAKNCVGRLVRMKNQHKEEVRIDPIYFFWARQDDEQVPYTPVDIFGNHDKWFLDIAKYKPLDGTLRFRVPMKNTVVWQEPGKDTRVGKDFDLATYYLQIAIYSDDAYIKPTWFKLRYDREQTNPNLIYVIKQEAP